MKVCTRSREETCGLQEVEGNQPQVALFRNVLVPRRNSSNTACVSVVSSPKVAVPEVGGVVGFGFHPIVSCPVVVRGGNEDTSFSGHRNHAALAT